MILRVVMMMGFMLVSVASAHSSARSIAQSISHSTAKANGKALSFQMSRGGVVQQSIGQSILSQSISAGPDDPEHLRLCQITAAQQAWGGQARFVGAPQEFKFIDRSVLEKMFHDDKIPHDGIYLANDMEPEDQEIYEDRAVAGWLKADGWISLGEAEPGPGYSMIMARLYFECKNAP